MSITYTKVMRGQVSKGQVDSGIYRSSELVTILSIMYVELGS